MARIAAILVLLALGAPAASSAQVVEPPAAVTAPAPPAPPRKEDREFRIYAYGGYTFSSIIAHGATASVLFNASREDYADWGDGIQATATVGQHGYVLGAGWAKCTRWMFPGCLDLRAVVGRTRGAVGDLAAHERFAGVEGGTVLLVLRLSAGLAFPLRDGGGRTPMFYGSIGFTPPIFTRNWFE